MGLVTVAKSNPVGDVTALLMVAAVAGVAYWIYLQVKGGSNADMGGTDFGTAPAPAGADPWGS
jgi:hypothetical protein